MTYQVNEIFRSYQGEGYWSGVPAVFIRLQGCPVGCEWCDTKYTWGAGGKKMTVDEIVRDIYWGDFVVITGGEPLIYNLDELLDKLQSMACYTQVESSGYTWLKGTKYPNWITWSPKPKLNWDTNSSMLHYCSEIKFVIDSEIEPSKVLWILNRMKTLPLHRIPQITFMPEGVPPTKKDMHRCMKFLEVLPPEYRSRYNWRISDRLQYRLGVK